MKQLVGGTMVLFARLQKTLISVQHTEDILLGLKYMEQEPIKAWLWLFYKVQY